MLKVGLTGGIASGKSEAASAFTNLGVAVVDADAVARELTAPGQPGLEQLLAALGRDILDATGRLDRARLRGRLFADATLKLQVERILHPLILSRLRLALDSFQPPYVIVVIPLLAESPEARTMVNRTLVVDCPEPLQLQRLMSRDAEHEASALAILSAQMPRSQRRAAGDDILFNTGSLTELTSAVAKLHRFYLDISGPALNRPLPARRGWAG